MMLFSGNKGGGSSSWTTHRTPELLRRLGPGDIGPREQDRRGAEAVGGRPLCPHLHPGGGGGVRCARQTARCDNTPTSQTYHTHTSSIQPHFQVIKPINPPDHTCCQYHPINTLFQSTSNPIYYPIKCAIDIGKGDALLGSTSIRLKELQDQESHDLSLHFKMRQQNGDLIPTEAHIDFNILFQFSKAQPIRARIAATKEALRQVELDLARLKAGLPRETEEGEEGGGEETA